MAKQITKQFKLQATGGKATPAPPIGPALGQHGVNPGQFIQQFNAASQHMMGKTCTVLVTVYADRSFSFELKSPPAATMIADAAGIEKGSGEPNKNKVGKITRDQIRKIAEVKYVDMNAASVEAAMRMVEGSARSMGVTVEG